MPILRVAEIRDMSPEEREDKLVELTTELTKMKTMIKAGGAVENPGRVRAIRRTIARIMTVKNEGE
ncbi:50S ribosomal protein L29 [Candidatus Bathyarchaeota archaeon RBG_16_57_9]|nr:MAG: 50S ribosomal protein L29 [Candidatus Bathyarchaeota archaeon RBG_16_57_9]OGD54096.1 MAG: 50S ribosomal protein L29 [Candidatus Bathyarchaeota archaeon RBG_13_60_20]